jgi:hypothetical protein
VSYQVNWEIRAADLATGFLSDDPAGIAELRESVSRLAEEGDFEEYWRFHLDRSVMPILLGIPLAGCGQG